MELNYLGKGDIEYKAHDEWMLDGYPIPAPVGKTERHAIVLDGTAPVKTGSRAYLYALPANGRKWLCAEVVVDMTGVGTDMLVPVTRGPRSSVDDEYRTMLRMLPALGDGWGDR